MMQAWHLWNEGNALELMDPLLTDGCPDEFLRFIQIALLCVQEDAFDRPTMSSVVVMLKGETVTLSQPQQPAFSAGRFAELHQTLTGGCSVNGLTISNIAPRWLTTLLIITFTSIDLNTNLQMKSYWLQTSQISTTDAMFEIINHKSMLKVCPHALPFTTLCIIYELLKAFCNFFLCNLLQFLCQVYNFCQFALPIIF